VDYSVRPESIPNEQWDATIWIARELDFKENENYLAKLPGTKKAAIVLYFESDKTNLKAKGDVPSSYQTSNIFSFIGDSYGLHPKSEQQREQESKLLNFIFA